MKSSLKNMVLVLTIISAVAAAGVGAVHSLTREAIEGSNAASQRTALEGVLPPFEQVETADAVAGGEAVRIHTALRGGVPVGYAVETLSRKGYSGDVRLMVGFTPEGEIINIEVLEQHETPGLGSKMADEGNPLLLSFRGKSPAAMKLAVRKDGGEVDALTAATISTRAYVDAVARAWEAFAGVTGAAPAAVVSGDSASGATDVEAASGATEVSEKDAASGATAQTGDVSLGDDGEGRGVHGRFERRSERGFEPGFERGIERGFERKKRDKNE